MSIAVCDNGSFVLRRLTCIQRADFKQFSEMKKPNSASRQKRVRFSDKVNIASSPEEAPVEDTQLANPSCHIEGSGVNLDAELFKPKESETGFIADHINISEHRNQEQKKVADVCELLSEEDSALTNTYDSSAKISRSDDNGNVNKCLKIEHCDKKYDLDVLNHKPQCPSDITETDVQLLRDSIKAEYKTITPLPEESEEQISSYFSCIEVNTSEKNYDLQEDQECDVPGTSQTRYGNACFEKQSSKMNSLVKKSAVKAFTAKELESVVFNAWCEVKKNNIKTDKDAESTVVKEANIKPDKSTSHEAYAAWVKSKRAFKMQEKKNDKRFISNTSKKQNSNVDKEESEVAFKYWVKKKEEFLKQQTIEKLRREREEKVNSLMNERVRRKNAETAYLDWKAHKYEVSKMEKRMKHWMMQHELDMNKNRSEDALKTYSLWLESKYSLKRTSYKMAELKPPWIPPGKS